MSSAKSAKKLYLKLISKQSGNPLVGIKVELLAVKKTQPDDKKMSTSSKKETVDSPEALASVLGELTSNSMGLVAFSNNSIWDVESCGRSLQLRFNGENTISLDLEALKEIAEIGPIRVPLDVLELHSAETHQDEYASWQDGGLSSNDFLFIPSMFPGFDDLEFGGDACSRLIPNDQTQREFDYKHIFVTERDAIQCGEIKLHRGEIIDFSIVWKRLGYSFGDLIYSLALAPGEHVTLAMSSWEQRQFASATRESNAQESLVGSYSRANSLTETMDMSSRSTSFGASLGLSAPLGKIPIKAALGLSTNVDRKSLSANSSRIFSDNIQQTAQRMRHDRQTIIVEQVETEDQSLSYRAVCNRNYCHVLNVFYHEVLENHRVSTYLMGHQNAVLVPYEVDDFDEQRAFCTHAILANHILDPCIDNCCEAIQRHLFAKTKKASLDDEVEDNLATRVRLEIAIGSNGQRGGQGFALLLYFKNGSVREIATPHGRKWKNGQYHVDVSTAAFDPTDVIKVGVKNNNSQGAFGSANIDVNSYTISFFSPDGSGPKALGSGSAGKLKRKSSHSIPVSYMPPPTLSTPTSQTAPSASPEDDAACVAAYVAHLNCHKNYYNSIIWMQEDPNKRIERFESIVCPDGNHLIDLVDPTPLGVYGNYVAFAEAGSVFEPDADQGIVDDRLVVLPTSGVFADVALGQCNACEDLPDEDSPFWKVIDKPNKCTGNTEIKPTGPTANSLFGTTGVGFNAPAATAWASAPNAPANESIANSLSAAFTAEVAKALLSNTPSADLKNLATIIDKLSSISKEINKEDETKPETETETETETEPELDSDPDPDGELDQDSNAPDPDLLA